LKKLRSVVRTYALNLETNDALKSEDSTKDYDKFRTGLSNSLINVNRTNELTEGLAVVLIRKNDDLAEVITSGGAVYPESFGPNVRKLLKVQPSGPLALGTSESMVKDHLFFAYPLELPGYESYHGYLFAEEYMGEEFAEAEMILWKRSGLALLMIAFLGWMGSRYLRRIFKHEVMSKKKLKDYADLAEQRNKDLEKLSFVLSKSENLILLTDKDGKIEWLNQRAKDRNNYSAEELNQFIGKELAEVSHYPKIKEVIDQVCRTKQKVIYEAKSYDETKQEFWASTTVTPILNEANEIENILFVDADITKLKRAEREISKLANFTQENNSAVMRFRYNGEVMYANDPGKHLLRHWNTSVDEIVQKPSILNTVKMVSELGREQKLNLECENRIYSLRFFPVKGKDYINVYAEDITEVKMAEKESRERASLVEKHNLNITDSINYAKRIQDAIIPGEDYIRKYFNDAFFFYEPKDIVSGDFVWLHESDAGKEYLVALADCTGHGVPGAMMSIIGHSLLNDIVQGEGITDPALILEELNKEVIKTLRQKNGSENSDGMDVSIIKINVPDRLITFSGAYQEIYWMNGKLNVFKGDRMPVGGQHHNFNRRYSNRSFHVAKGDCIFLASDGFADQFGGPENKKFLKKRLMDLLKKNHKYSMQAQSFIYKKAFMEWKGNAEQVDDVSMLGIKF
jgi:PAS domain S-box-containing protein